MLKIYRRIGLLMILLILCSQVAWAAPAPGILQNMRYSQTQEKVRIVFDVNKFPEYTVKLQENPAQLVIEFASTVNKVKLPQIVFNDSAVASLRLSEVEPGKQRVAIDLKTAVMYKVFTLPNPNRVVVDIIKGYDHKIEEEVVPGVKYTSLFRGTAAGPISAHVLDISPDSDYIIKPVLSNDVINHLEKLQPMALQSKAVAAVNGSYFASNGEILGMLKIDGEIVSTPCIGRTALGVLPDGKIMIDQIDYSGSITLPDGRTVAITGVNHERGTDDLILYNRYYDSMTGTNEYGTDYIISNGKIIDIAHGNMQIPPDGVVLSAHGSNEKVLADLKIGDNIKINQTLGSIWDKTSHVMGAGPRLVKNKSVFLTTKSEGFGSDVAGGRAPRTAVGVNKDGHILIVVVDGRQHHSIGMTLLELALFMQDIGAVDAMNLDGGGSSEMIVDGKTVNKPSDGRERSLGDALIVVSKY